MWGGKHRSWGNSLGRWAGPLPPKRKNICTGHRPEELNRGDLNSMTPTSRLVLGLRLRTEPWSARGMQETRELTLPEMVAKEDKNCLCLPGPLLQSGGWLPTCHWEPGVLPP